MAQFQAGYFFGKLPELFAEDSRHQAVQQLLKSLSFFELITSHKLPPPQEKTPAADVATNIISRGLPTRPSPFVEKTIASQFEILQYHPNQNQLALKLPENEKEQYKDLFFKSLHLIDPRINRKNQNHALFEYFLSNGYPADLRFSILPEYLGEQFIQLFEQNRPFHTIFSPENTNELPNYAKHDFDLALEIPYQIHSQKGITIALKPDEAPTITEKKRNDYTHQALEKNGWAEPLIISIKDRPEIQHRLSPLYNFVVKEEEFFGTVRENYYKPIYLTEKGLDALEIALAPVAIARLQKTIAEAIRRQHLSLAAKKWTICVVERDLPCAHLATEDFKKLWKNIAQAAKAPPLPEIELLAFGTPEFENAKLHKAFSKKTKPIKLFPHDKEFDLLIDISILQRKGIYLPLDAPKAAHKIVLRSAHAITSENHFAASKKTEYHGFEPKHFNYFLDLFFREKTEKPQLFAIAKSLLQTQNIAALNQNFQHKAFVFGIAALLQPALTLAVLPNAQAMANYKAFYQSHQMAFSASFRKTPKSKAQHSVNQNKALLLQILPELLHTPESHQLFAQKPQKTAQCLIDNAEQASLWANDFSVFYSFVNQNIKQIFGESHSPTLAAFAQPGDHNQTTDIQSEIQLSRKQILENLPDFSTLDFQLVASQNAEIAQENDLHQIIGNNAQKKQVAVYQILNSEEKIEQTLIFCPEQTGKAGIFDANHDGLADKLEKVFPELLFSVFPGVGAHTLYPVSSALEKQAQQARQRFAKGETQVLISVPLPEAVPDNTQNLIFLNFPRNFCQLSNLTSPLAGKKARIRIVFNARLLNLAQKAKAQLPNALQKQGFASIDGYTNRFLLRHVFKGEDKEKRILNELLSQISFHSEKNFKKIACDLSDKFGEELEIELLPAAFPYQIHIRNDEKTLGYIDFTQRKRIVVQDEQMEERAEKMLIFVRAEVEKLCPAGQDSFEWLNDKPSISPLPGIEKQLENLKAGQMASLKLGFANDRFNQIKKLLDRFAPRTFSDNSIEKAYRKAATAEEFVEMLQTVANIQIVTKEINLPKQLKALFHQIRDKNDTFRALFYLKTLGLIDNFSLDRPNERLELHFTRHDEEFYLNQLLRHIKKYVPEKALAPILDQIVNHEGETILRQLANFLVHFTYQNVLAEHLQQIDFMEHACIKSVQQNATSQLNQHLALFAKAKYASPLHQPNLQTDTDFLRKQNFELVAKYRKLADQSVSEILHLKDSCREIKKDPQAAKNYTILVLSAYSSLLCPETTNKEADHALDELLEGFLMYQKENRLSQETLQAEISDFLKKTYDHTPQKLKKSQNLLQLKLTNQWLLNFNRNFLENYE